MPAAQAAEGQRCFAISGNPARREAVAAWLATTVQAGPVFFTISKGGTFERMERYLNDDHRSFVHEVRGFAREAVAPVAAALDRESRFPWVNVSAMAERGYLGIPVPTALGGLGKDALTYLLTVEELAKVDVSHAITVSAHTTLGTYPILSFGDEAQQKRFVPRLAKGEVLGGFGLTEPGAGSDAGGTRTRAVRDGDGWRLNGSKIFITHAGVGEIFTVTAVSEPAKGTKGITSFVVTKPTADPDEASKAGMGSVADLGYIDGVRAGKKEDKMGWRSSDTRELLLEDAWVPDSNRIGGEGEGFINFMKILDAGRIGVAALSVGLAQGAIDAALAYTNKRKQFGRIIFDFQPVQFRLAELATELEAARHLTYHAAWLMETGRPFSKEAAMAKLFASELSMKATMQAVQVMGGAGYSEAFPVERMFRDAKICEIGEGTSEVQKMVIARHLVREMQHQL
jgi:alkylation response protein AidB-like acyl-CoA dehydrogenase